MRRTLDLALRGWGRVHPNPMVGAVVECDGSVIAEGFHAGYGGPHAEVAALAAAGERARAATLYVSLEPCAHHGKTPPCTDAIVAAGVRRVVFGATDPDPLAAGGAAALHEHGIEVIGGVEADAARALNAAFFHVHERHSPFVALKLAISLDGRLSRTAGAPTHVSGDEAMAEVHRLRAGFDAILVGAGTALADDPLLTARGDIAPRVPPIRMVADSRLRLPPGSRLARDARGVPVRVLTTDGAPADRAEALAARGVHVVRLAAEHGHVGTVPMLDRLWADGVRTVLCEGGGRLAAALLAADRVARLILFIAPAFFGEAGTPAFPVGAAGGPWTDPSAWRLADARPVGRDALLVWDRVYPAMSVEPTR